MMKFCENQHETIVYDSIKCPFCIALDEAEEVQQWVNHIEETLKATIPEDAFKHIKSQYIRN